LAAKFGKGIKPNQNQFANMRFTRHTKGFVLLDQVVNAYICEVLEKVLAGDHFIIIARVDEQLASTSASHLVYNNQEYTSPLHAIYIKKLPSNSTPLEALNPVSVITGCNNKRESEPMGVSTSHFSSCSLNPPLLSILIPGSSKMTSLFLSFDKRSNTYFSVHLLTKVRLVAN
jgi:flavin reductase (DIM6/NTAB) family NADH-FMN oxidoreductase RutF